MVHKILQLFLLTGTLFGQLLNAQPIQGNINDFETKAPVPYALVTNTKRTIGINTDSLGFFKIDSTLSLQFDSLRVSAIGYKSIVIALVGSKPLTVYLNKIQTDAESLILNEKPTNKKIVTLGAKANFINPMYGCYTDSMSNTEIALLIQNTKNKVAKIETIGFFLRNLGVINAPFRIRVYQNNNDKPGAEITTKNIIVRGYSKNAWNKFDVSSYNLVLPLTGCFISMEWLNWGDRKYQYEMAMNSGDMGYGQSIGLTSEFSFSASFMRSNSNVWKTWEEWWGLTSNSTLLLPTVYTPMIRAEVYY